MLRRHLSRASSKLLPSDSSLYNAMQAIIGQELRARYEMPQEVPPEMLKLLAHLDEQAGKNRRLSIRNRNRNITLSTLIRRLSTKGELHDKTGVQFLDGAGLRKWRSVIAY